MQEQEIYQQFAGKWLRSGAEYYVSKEAAADFVQQPHQLDIVILGIEGIVISQNQTRLLLDAIADYSSTATPRRASIEQVSHYLNATANKVTHYCFVVETS